MKTKTLRQRLLGSFAVLSLALPITALQELILVPFYLLSWNTDVYRDWLVIIAATEFLAILDLGLQSYFANKFMAAQAAGKHRAYQRLRNLAFNLYGYLLIVVISLIVFGTQLAETDSINPLFGIKHPDSLTLLLLLGLVVMIRMPLGIFSGIYRAKGDPARALGFDTVATIIRVALTAILLANGTGPVGIATFILVFWLGAGIIMVIDHHRRYNDPFPQWIKIRSRELSEAFRLGFQYSAQGAASIASVHGLVLLTAYLAPNGIAVIVLTTARTLTGIVRQIALQIAAIIGIEQSRALASKKNHEFDKLQGLSLRLTGSIVGLSAGFIAIIGEDFLNLWTHNRIPFDNGLLATLLIAIALSTPARTASQVLIYTNQPLLIAWSQGAVAIMLLLLTPLFIPTYGALGAAGALLLAEFLAVTLWLGKHVAKIHNSPWTQQISQGFGYSLLSAIISFPIAILAYGLVNEIYGAESSWLTLTFVLLTWLSLSILPSWFLLISTPERKILLSLFKKRK